MNARQRRIAFRYELRAGIPLARWIRAIRDRFEQGIWPQLLPKIIVEGISIGGFQYMRPPSLVPIEYFYAHDGNAFLGYISAPVVPKGSRLTVNFSRSHRDPVAARRQETIEVIAGIRDEHGMPWVSRGRLQFAEGATTATLTTASFPADGVLRVLLMVCVHAQPTATERLIYLSWRGPGLHVSPAKEAALARRVLNCEVQEPKPFLLAKIPQHRKR